MDLSQESVRGFEVVHCFSKRNKANEYPDTALRSQGGPGRPGDAELQPADQPAASRTIFIVEEPSSRYSGTRERPRALNMAESTL